MIFLCIDGYTSIRSALKIANSTDTDNYIVSSRKELKVLVTNSKDEYLNTYFITLPFIGHSPSGDGIWRCIYSTVFCFLSVLAIKMKITQGIGQRPICISDKKRCYISLSIFHFFYENLFFFSHNEFGKSHKINFKKIRYVRENKFLSQDIVLSPTANKTNNKQPQLILLPKFTQSVEYTLEIITEFLEVIQESGLRVTVSLHPKIRSLEHKLKDHVMIENLTVGNAGELAVGCGSVVIWHGTSVEFFSGEKWKRYVYWHDSFLSNSPEGNRYEDVQIVTSARDFINSYHSENKKNGLR